MAAAVDGAMIAKFRGGGQACTAANRFYVHAAVAEEFTARLAEQVSELTVGRGAAAEASATAWPPTSALSRA